MSQSSTARVRRPSSLFQPGGLKWVAMPDVAPGAGRTVLAGILRLARRNTEVWDSDAAIAGAAACSLRLVQKGLRELERARWIMRKRWRGTRKITLLFRLAGQCTYSHERAAPIGTDVPHLFAPACETLKYEEREETKPGPPALPGQGRSGVPSEENLSPPCPAMRRFFAHAIPATMGGEA